MDQSQSTIKYKNRKMYRPPPQQDYTSNFRKLIIVIIMSFVFIAGQFVGGYISGSISVISDAFHLVTDLIGFVVSFVFIWFSRKKPNQIMSFGYHRMQLLGALGNLFIIWALALFLIYQATLRIPKIMLIVACIGLPINIVMYFVLHAGSSHSHGLMSQACGEEYQTDNNQSVCQQLMCQDIQCLINNQYLQHCHKQAEGNSQIHKHKNKVQVQGNKIIRSNSIEMKEVGDKHDHKNCNGNHQGHDHNHQGHDHNHEGHDHNHQHRSHSADNKVVNSDTNMIDNSKGKIHDHNGKSCDHDHSKDHKHQGHDHNHEGHDHQGHDHQGHDHQGHDHNHQGHDHHGHGHSHQSMSMKAAVLHALSDIIQSIGLVISSLAIFFFGSHFGQQVDEWNNWHLFDPIGTYIFSVIVLVSTWPITKNCYHIIMESTPGHLNMKQMTDQIAKVQGVVDVHDLHIWDLRPGKTILIAHVFSQTGTQRKVLKKLTDLSRKKKIYHSTFQIQQVDYKDHQQYILCDHDIH